MRIAKLKRAIKKHQPFDLLAILVLASFAVIIMSILSTDVEKFSREMDAEARHLQADMLSIKALSNFNE